MHADDDADLDPQVLADPLDGDDDDVDDADSQAGEAEDGPASAAVVDSTPPRSDTETGTALVPAEAGKLAKFDPFRHYMAEVRAYPVLDRDEEQALARRYRETGDREALFRLVTSNLMLVVRVALSFRRAARNLLDLIQEGNLGLLAAIDRFDPELGVRLPTYAAWWVRAYMVKFLLDNVRLVRVGTTNARRKLLRNLRKEKARLEALGYEADTRQLAEHFGVSETDVKDVQAALDSHDVYLDAPASPDGEGASPRDTLPAAEPSVEEEVARRELQERTEEAIGRFREDLDERERSILDQRILSDDPLTLQVLGDRFGVTREAVRQAEGRLMKRLTEYLRNELGDLGEIDFG